LENTLRDRAWIDLNLEERPQAVANPLHLDVETLDEPQLLPPGTRILDRFDTLGEGRTLLILGEPGSGKTTTLLELARNLVTRAEQDIGQLIPVVFNLSSWVSEKQNVCDWLVKELNTKYQVPKKVGQTWANKQQLLLLLDGLDEVQAEYREGLIDALNAFHQEYGSELVVTSRIQDYQLLSNRLKFQSAVYLRSLTSKQVFLSLEGNNSYLVKLRDLLLKDEILRQLAQSPLMLNIITMAYEGIALEDLPKTGLMEERRQQLFHAYIEQMFKRRGAKHQYSQAQTLHWLTWLAQRMSQFGQTVFLIEGMQPDWLQTQAQLRAYHIGVKLILGMVWGGLHVGLLAGHMGGDAIRFDLLNNVQGLIAGLSGGLIYGLIGGWLWRLGNEPTNHGYGRLINSLLLGVIFGPIFGWIYGGWMYGLAYTLIYGVIGLFSYRPLHFAESIEPIDSLRWSWRKALRYSGFGLIIGFLLKFGTPTPLIPSLIFGVMLSLIFGFEKADEVDRTTVPNQSIWKSVANSGKLFLTIGLLTGLILGAIENPIFGIVNGLIFGVAAALMGGQGAGIICIKHFTLRCLLWWSGYIPWNYARFLDYASDRVFLQKVGGGYVFVHRLLCDHFARMELTPVRR
jgi:eukaryotic-like serine/threonine-protein kinase